MRRVLIIFLLLVSENNHNVIFISDKKPLECYVCGISPFDTCDKFNPGNSSFIEICSKTSKSCVKSHGTFQNVTSK